MKPGDPFHELTKLIKSSEVNNFNKDTIVVLLGGSNDVYRKATIEPKQCLNNLTNTNVLVVDIPQCHDLPTWSCML